LEIQEEIMIRRAKWKSIKYGEIEGYAYEDFVEKNSEWNL
jgi:hypothetical protein